MGNFLRTTVHGLLLLCFLIVAVTGIMKAAAYHSHILGEIHEIAGLVLIGFVLAHIYIFRHMLLLLFKRSTK